MAETTDTLAIGSSTVEDLRRLCGDVLDWKLQAILETGASLAEVETAVAWAGGDDAILVRDDKPLSGRAADVYEILTADAEPEEDR